MTTQAPKPLPMDPETLAKNIEVNDWFRSRYTGPVWNVADVDRLLATIAHQAEQMKAEYRRGWDAAWKECTLLDQPAPDEDDIQTMPQPGESHDRG